MTYRTPLEASQRDASNGRHHAPALARRHVAGAWTAPAEGVLRCAQSACSRGACGPHICPSSKGVCASVWAHRCELGRACVGMRGHAWARARPTRARDAACLYSCEGYSRAKHRPRYQPASDYTQRTTGAPFSSGARRWSMRMGAWRGRTFICVCLISLSTRSAKSRQAGERLGWCPHIECHLPRGPAGHLLMM